MSYLSIIDAGGIHRNYSGSGPRDEVRGLIKTNFELYKTFPLCQTCPDAAECKMPNVPGLKLTCPRTPGYRVAARARG